MEADPEPAGRNPTPLEDPMTQEASLLTRTLKLGSYGKDVDAAKRGIYRGLDKLDGGHRLKVHATKKKLETDAQFLRRKRTYGPFFKTSVNQLRHTQGFAKSGVVDKVFWSFITKKGFPDSLAFDLMQQWIDEHKKPPPAPKYVEPRQGFDSLDRRLWPLYTTGRNMGMFDLGTYNPQSRLPSGRPSDHAVYPAVAFDLGFTPQTGYGNPTARSFFHLMAGHPDVEYVILGNKIYSVERGLHAYSDSSSHAGHVHVSGHRR